MTVEGMIGSLMEHDRVSHADMVYMLRDGCYRTIYADSRKGIVLEHPVGTVFASPFTDDFMPLVEAIGDGVTLLNIHGKAMSDWYRGRGFKFREECWTYAYDENLGYRDEGPWRYGKLSVSDYPTVRAHYKMCQDAEVMDDLARGDVYGMYSDDGALMGFAGFHPEGSMGLLEIFPEYRRRGLGTYMESFIINEAMRRGRIPFCNVYISNAVSEKLQSDLGLERGKILSYWVWR